MSTAYTQRAIIVARPAVAAALNAKAHEINPEGDDNITVPLRLAGDDTNTIRAYWCSWALKPAEVTALRTKFQAAGMTTAEDTIVMGSEKETFTPDQAARLYIFDARDGVGWTPQEVLDALGLDTLASPLLTQGA